ncbi:MAG: gliding motility-associated C-terminal domain-containing protein [Saprospiraceae bacterium]
MRIQFIILIFFVVINWKPTVAQSNSCTPTLSIFSPFNADSGALVSAETERPGIPAGCLEVGIQMMGSQSDNELVQNALIRIEEVNCEGDENPVLIFEKLIERALPFGALSFPFDGELIGRPGEETICYFIKKTVQGEAIGKCYKLSAEYNMNCGGSGILFSYFYMEPDFCFFRNEVPDFRVDRQVICAGECIKFEPYNLQIPDDFEWHFIGGEPEFSTRFPPPEICYSEPGIYAVEMLSSSCLRADTIYKTDFIEVLPAMELSFPATQQLTINEKVEIELNACAQGENFTYNWFPRDQLSCWDCPNPIFTAAENIDYQITARNAAGCEVKCEISIEVLRKPVANFVLSDSLLCVGDCVSLTNFSNFSPTSYEWQFPNGSIERFTEADPPQICYSTAGTFPINLIVKNEVGSDTLAQQIQVFPTVETIAPEAQKITIVADSDFQLDACGIGSTYEWQPINGLSCTDCPNPILNISQPIDYELIINKNSSCKTRCFYEIDIVFEPANLYLPTAFSPNGDGINDVYQWFGKNLELRQFSIFNRWGELVFQTTDANQFWDGKFRNETAAAGVYYGVLKYLDLNTGYVEIKTGSISLIR